MNYPNSCIKISPIIPIPFEKNSHRESLNKISTPFKVKRRNVLIKHKDIYKELCEDQINI